ncbi:MAG: tetratricopeptide repeat protein [Bacteroidota bacterium]
MNDETIEFDIEFLTQKISENPRSPLFARLADFYLYKEQTVEALSLCKEGLGYYPEYYAGYIVLGKVHTALKEYSKARTAFATAKHLAPFNQIVVQLMRSLPSTPDESDRTTDESYFAPPAPATEEHLPHQEAAAPVGMVSDEELSYTQSPEPSFGQTPAYTPAPSTGQFPSFDEYAQQNMDRIDATPAMALDEYLSLSAPPESPRVFR